MRTSLAQGRYAPSAPTEWDVQFFRGETPNGILFFHGSGNTATTTFTVTETYDLCAQLGRIGHVLAGDFALQSWGNNAGIARTVDGTDCLDAIDGISGPFVFVAGSMGNAIAMAAALAHPTLCAGIAGIIPLTDIADIRLRGAAASVDAAYPPAYNDATDGPTHSPVRFATALPAELPIHLWSSSDDPLCPPATAHAFVDQRYQTGFTDLGPLGHTNAALAAATPDVVEFVRGIFEGGAG